MATPVLTMMKKMALAAVVLLLVALAGPPIAAYAAVGPINTTAQAANITVKVLGGLIPVTIALPDPAKTWTTGGAASTSSTVGANVPGVLNLGAVNSSVGPVTGGGTASAGTAGLGALGALSVGAVQTSCTMSASTIATTTDVANLNVGGQVINPSVNLPLEVAGVLSLIVDHRVATYNTSTGRLNYSVRALDVALIPGGAVVDGSIIVGQSTCSGIVKLGAVNLAPATLAPGENGTPKVTVTNTGDVAAPSTTIRIPMPPTGYTLGTPTVTGGGTCTTSATFITCTGVTVPGSGNAVVSLPVSLAASATSAADWAPAASTITAVSTPIPGVTDTTISVNGGGTLVNRAAPKSTGGSITVTPMSLAAGKAATTPVTVANDGPSDATTTVTIPLADKPAGVSIVSATVAGNPCSVNATAITCTGVVVPGGGTSTISLRAAATTTTAPGTVWNVTGMAATLNGTAISGAGRVLTVSDPDVNLDTGVTITPATAVPGDGVATPTVRVRNLGIIPATGTTITLPAPPAGYTAGTVTTTGGGTCTTTNGIRCTGVTVPATGTVTVSVPVTLGAGVTAGWSAAAGEPVTATSGDSTGTATGTIVAADPQWTLGVTATGPAARTVRPGQTATMSVTVSDNGPSDARAASYVVVAPQGTTFGTLTGTAAACTQLSPTTLRCTNDIPAAGPAVTLTLPLVVSAQADPATPLTGGCVSLNNDTSCGDPGDKPLPAIELRTPIANRLTVTTTPATIVPGENGTGRVGLTSTQSEDDLSVTIPVTGLPAGFTATGATGPAGSTCTVGAAVITCEGVDLSAGQADSIAVAVAVASSVTPPATWNVSPITVSDGGEQMTSSGPLANAGTPAYQLTATVTGPPDNTVEPGQTTDLSLTVRNSGPSDAPATPFGVIPPTGTTFGAPTGPAATACTVAPDGTSASCTVALAAGVSSPQLTLPVSIPAGADVNTPLGGACVDLNNNGSCGGAPDKAFDPIILKVPFAQRVTITATPVTVTPGSSGSATVAVNAVHGAVSGLTVTVPLVLPTGLSVTSASLTGATCTIGGGNVTCPNVTISNGGTAAISVVVAATAGTAQGTDWTATGITVSDGADQITADKQLATVGAPSYRLATTVTVPDEGELEPGDTGDLSVEVDNLGPSDATGARIGVLAPAGVTFEPLADPGTMAACTLTDTTHATCLFDLAEAATPLTFLFPIKIDGGADPGQPVDGGCIDLDNNGVCGPGDPGIPDIYLATPLAQVVTVGTGPGTIVPGRAGTGQVTLRSTRPETGLTVSIPLADLPAGFTASAAAVDGGTCTVNGTTAITCTGVALTAGVTKTVDVQVAVASSVVPPQTWSTTVTVTDGTDSVDGTGPIATAGTPADAVTVTVTGPADGTVTAGSTTNLTVVATNAGPSDATGRTFVVTAPTSTTFGTLTDAAAVARCTRAGDGLSVSCTVTLPAGTSTPDLLLPLVVDANADPFTPVTGGCVNLSGTAGCSGPGDRPVPTIMLKVPFDRRAQLVTAAATVTPGTQETATVGVKALHGALSNLTLTVPLGAVPASLTVTPADAGCTATAGQIRCTGINVADQQTTSVTLRVRADAGAAEGTTWTATGVTVDAGGGNQITGDPQLAVVGPPRATLDAVVTLPQPAILPGGSGTLTVDVDNLGPSDLATATIGIAVPTGATLGTLTAPTSTLCTANAARTRLTCTFPLTAAAAPLRFPVPLDVPAGANPRTPLPGGCIDLNNDGTCADPPDRPIPPMPLSTPFNQQVTISTTPATVTPGRNGVARVTVGTDPAQSNLTVRVPLNDKPGDVFAGAPSVAPSGTCTLQTGFVECTGVDIAAGTAATVTIPLSVTAAAANGTWTATGITVTNPGGDTATANGVLLNTGTASYTLTATTSGPAPGTVLPGETTSVTMTLDNTGPSDAVNAPVTLNAPAGTSFGTLDGAIAQSCTVASASTLTCRVTLAADDQPLVWTLPIVIPANADPAVAITGGCADLGGDGACGGTGDVVLPDITLRAPLGTVLTVSADNPSLTPGTSGTATVSVAASAARQGLTVRVDTGSLPSGLTLTGATTCAVQTGFVECTGVDIAAGGTYGIPLSLSADAGAAEAVWTPAVTITQGSETVTRTPGAATIGAPVHPLSVAVTVPAPGTLLPGATGDLGVTVTNAGPSLYRQARVQFKAPTGTTFAALTTPADGFCTATATVVTCVRDLPEGDLAFPLRIVVPGTADPDDVLDDGCYDANLDGDCTNPPDGYFPPITLDSPLSADARISTEPGTAVPGGPASPGYVVVDADRAISGLTATVPTNTLPAGFTITGATGPSGSACTFTTDVVCTGVSLTTGSHRVITVTVTAASSLGTAISWTPGPITMTDGSGQSTQAPSGTLITTGDPIAAVTYETSLPPGPVEVGGTTTLTVTATNAGPSDAMHVVTSILAPPYTTFGPLTGRADDDCILADGNVRIDCDFSVPMTAPQVVWSVPVQVAPDAPPAIVLTGGCLDKGSDGACTSGDPSLPGIPTTRTLDQAITVSADNKTITAGSTGTATVTVASADARTGLTVTVPRAGLPAGTAVVSARQGGTTDCVISTDAVTCSGVDLTAGGSTGIALALTPVSSATPGQWTPAIVVAQAARTITRNVPTATIVTAANAFTVTVVAPAAGTVLPGSTADLAVTVTNTGPATTRSLAFTAPSGTTFGTPSLAGCTVDTPAAVTCPVAVAADGTLQFTLPVAVPLGATSPVGGGCVTVSTTCEPLPAIELATPLGGRVTLATVPVTITPGQTGTAVVRATATGAIPGTTVTVPLTLPAGLLVTGASGPAGSTCTLASTQVTCTGVNLVQGQTNAVSLVVRAASALRNGVTWTASGITLTVNGESVPGGGQLATTGTPSSPLAVAVSGPSGNVEVAGTTTMSVTVTNPGPSDAIGVTATVSAPTNSTFGALSGQAALDCNPSSTVVLSCTITQAVGTAAKIWNLPVVVSSTALDGDIVGNGCFTRDGVSTCGGSATVVAFASDRPLKDTATVTITPKTIPAGTTGNATISVVSTADKTGVTLTVPLTGLPAGMTVTSATVGDADCTVTAGTAVACRAFNLIANQAVTVTLAVTVDGSVTTGTLWSVTGVTLSNDANNTDVLTAQGTLVTTTTADYTVTVNVGTPSVPRPAPGQTTILPITLTNSGPQDADPYTATFVLPTGTTHGTLPTGCSEGSTARIVTCTLAIADGETTELDLPLIIDASATVGSKLTGGCVDGGNTGTCGATDDLALPDLTVSAPTVDLDIDYSNPAPTATQGKAILLKLPYSNNGSQSASDVTFLINPPTGTTLTKAVVLLDASATDFTAAATEADTVELTCDPAPDVDSNAVTCTGPEAPVGSSSELWLYLAVAKTAKAGTFPVTVTISTTSTEGNTVNNTATANLTIASTPTDTDDDPTDPTTTPPTDNSDTTTGSGNLPKTGQDLTGLLLLAILMIIGGGAARLAARKGRTR
ncbi:beta strand repeat-containing protein [Winogradskya humida]|uniref:Repeat protein (TIGR01451 family) n=1 Tax=Winogradskya humida TaxID=113566 RepID=A0ABQ3ZH55_9ACTN|nr:hypothetical protein [Actinoplanes humidus]GIE17877.1 hypothetical protein Ahu01nite_009790 [Actinoplanes humidus]